MLGKAIYEVRQWKGKEKREPNYEIQPNYEIH